MKIYVSFLALFLLLNLTVMPDYAPFPFYNMVALLIPFDLETESFLFGRFFLTLSMYIVLLTYVQKQLEAQFTMMNYTLTRIGFQKLMIKCSIYTYKKILIVLFIWIFSMLIFSQMYGLENVEIFISLSLSMIITMFIWIEIFMLLKLTKMPLRNIYLLSFFLISLLIPFSEQFQFTNLLIIGSLDILNTSVLWIGVKMVFWFLLLGTKSYLFKNFEVLGDDRID
ncbi:MAG: hypothetical protein FWG67_04085 [Defluviitaleaceae bacterium]|nr:hypothetical protein [Defluviitaleaceae bacterium]